MNGIAAEPNSPGDLHRAPRGTMAIIEVLLLVGTGFLGARGIDAARMSSAVLFIRSCGGFTHLKTEEHSCWIEEGTVHSSHNFNNSPKGCDWRWSQLFFRGLAPRDVQGVEIPIELEEIGDPELAQRAIETACAFPDLEWLDIRCAQVSAGDVSRLANLSRLKLVLVNSTSDRAALRRLLETNPNVEIYLTDSESRRIELVQFVTDESL